jgi:uncharacterized protein YndB with AHSA1/START domain
MTQTARRLKQHIHLNAPVERVYQALTDADQLSRWFPSRVKSDPRLGGELRFEFQKGDHVYVVEGRYLELVPNQLVSYSWVSPLDADAPYMNLTLVFRLEAKGETTDLYLEETGYGEGRLYEEMYEERTGGWQFFFANLAALLEGRPDARGVEKSPCES